jgi:glyoxylase-like metal-dependent hydrolase (beta-lactamase superfamily II)
VRCGDRPVVSRLKFQLSLAAALAAMTLAPCGVMAQPAPAAGPAPAAPRAGPPRPFVQIKDGLWRAGQGNNWWSLVYDTPDGLLIVDPLSPDFASYLKGELARRFPGKKVRYIVYSHTHWDHAAGAAAFADDHPIIVAQERALTNMDGRWPHMPGAMTDRNHNGRLDNEEMVIATLEHPGICGMGQGTFESIDKAHKGSLTGDEWFADTGVVKPDIVYSQRMTITLGGRRIELVFPGLNHADDGTVVFFPAERVAFSADFPADALVTTSMRSMPSSCGAFDQHPLSEWIRSYKTIEALDFDILAQGHGQVNFTKADVVEGRKFFETLRDQVSKAIASGKSLEETKRTVLLPQYKDWAYYDMLRPLDVEAAYLNLKTYK